jgi:NitT/TauT family transport system ATP-binding protein
VADTAAEPAVEPVAIAPEPIVSVRGVSRVHGRDTQRVLALDGIDLDVHEGEFVCLVGASGCGKSTLLHMIAGLDEPTSGELKVRDSHVAMLFQDAALFPWLTVAENVAFPLKMRRVPRAQRAKRVAELLALVKLTKFADHRPHQLSGGMRQRTALARALAQDAKILLMDEPFAALDALIRDRMHDELERIWSEAKLTVVFVTHNPREAVRLADRVILMSSRPGRVVQEFEVKLPRPRRLDSSAVSSMAMKITDRLKEVIHASDRDDE